MALADIRRQVGQLVWTGLPRSDAGAAELRRISDGETGSIILAAHNVSTLPALCDLTRALHEAAPADAPLLVTISHEGGRAQRLPPPATRWPPMRRLGERAARNAPQAEVLAERVGRALGAEVAALGFDLVFAPVLDVHTNPANPVIGDRAFATTPELVIRMGGAFARGLASAGVLPCGKHFPGHGDTAADSHLELPRVRHDAARLRAVELAPFAALVHELPVVMTAHVIHAALDDVPATLSRRALTDLLRGELGFRGVIVSDDLEMKAISDRHAVDEAAVLALRAGCDAFLVTLVPDWQRLVFDGLVRAAERSSDLRARVAESAARVAALKRAHFARPRPPLDASVPGSLGQLALAAELA